MKVWGIVPARGGSQGIPRKNIANLGGKPLLTWTAAVALESSLERVILSTEDDEIARVGRAAGLEVPFKRPDELASHDSKSIDLVLHALDALDGEPDAVMLLQPTTPFRAVSDIEGAITMLEGDLETDSVISVAPVGGHHPARMQYVHDGILVNPPFAEAIEGTPRQFLDPLYIRNGAIYLTRTPVLRAGSFRGATSRAWIMPPERSVNLDDPFDLIVARALAGAW